MSPIKSPTNTLRKHGPGFETLIDSIDGIVWEVDFATFSFTYVSPQAERLLGYPLDEWYATPNAWVKHLHPEDRDAAVDFCLAESRACRHHSFEYRMIAADGRVVWMRDIVTVVLDEGAPVSLRGVMVDVTDARLTEQRLRDSEQRLKEALRMGSMAYWELDLATLERYWSDEMFRLFERDRQAGIPAFDEALNDYLLPEDRQRIEDALRQASETGEPAKVDVRIKLPSRRTAYFASTMRPIKDAGGRVTKLTGVVQDITERKTTEQRLRDSERRLELALAGAELHLWEFDLFTRRIEYSSDFPAFLGYNADELEPTAKFWANQLHPDDLPAAVSAWQEHIEGRVAAYQVEFRVRTRRGDWKWLHVRGQVAERDEQGRPLRVAGTVLDITERKEAEGVIRESERRFRATFEQSAVGMAHFSPDGLCLRANRRFADMLGYTAEELVGMHYSALTHPDDVDRVAIVLQRIADGELDAFQLEKRYLRKDGESMWGQTTISTMRGEKGSAQLFNVACSDITERKENERRLQEMQGQLEAATSIARLGFWEFDLRTNEVYFSREWKRQVGYDDWELPNRPEEWSSRVHPDDWETIQARRKRALEAPQLEQPPFEYRLRHKDGSYRWILSRIAPRVDDLGQVVKLTGIHLDVTERKEAEEALRASRAMFQGLFESAPDAIVVGEPSGRIIRANRQAAAMFGYTPDELYGQDIEILLPERFREEHPTFRAGYMAQPQLRSMGTGLESRGRRKDGSEFPVDITLGTLETESGPVALSIIRDISERQQAEAERRARLTAEAASLAKSEFLANMSHELRSPLNTILGFARLMTNDPELPATARDNLELISRSGEHLYTLVNQVLDLSKLEAGRATFNQADFDLHLLLDDLRSLFAHTAAAKGLQLLLAGGPDVPRRVRSDALKLRQVLINLLDNAIKFTVEGHVSLSVDLPPADRAIPENGVVRLVFAVADSGPGIAPGELPHLFGAFVQAEAGRQESHGTGLGLAISRGFVRLLGGEMTIESDVGKGTTVRFEIPVRIVAEKPVAGEAKYRRVLGLAQAQSRYRILVVDDQAEAREILVRLLAPLGFEVREATNGQEAIEAWQHWRPHLIWMDVAMPGLDGLEATRRIRIEPRGRRVVVVAVTGGIDEAERSKVLAAGCDELLRKPIREADVFAALEKYLQVQFVYEEKQPETALPLSPQTLAELPEDKRTALEDALIHLDADVIERTIDDIRASDAEVAEALAACARDFQYESILSALHGELHGDPRGTHRP
jgi:two-component system, sensor histidine kinase and response regulator